MKKWGYVLLAVLWIGICATGPAWAEARQVTIALGSEPTTLDPQIREDGGGAGRERQYL